MFTNENSDKSRIWLLVQKMSLMQMVSQVENLRNVKEVRFSDDLARFWTDGKLFNTALFWLF